MAEDWENRYIQTKVLEEGHTPLLSEQRKAQLDAAIAKNPNREKPNSGAIIHGSFQNLELSLDQLVEVVDLLHDRMMPVLTPPPDVNELKDPIPIEEHKPWSPMAETVKNIVMGMDNVRFRIEDIINRIEL